MKMKLFVLAVAMALLAVPAAIPAWAQALTTGQVMKVDTSASKITIKHGPMKKFDMDDGMTMVYRVKDPAMLGVAKAGDKILFDADHVNGQYIVTKIEKAK